MFDLKINNLTKDFGELRAVNDVSIHINVGEFFSILGPSGCGKSTTLRMVAGFVLPTNGQILVGDTDITYQAPEKRNIGFVFQNYAIFPHMNVFDNISFGLRMRNFDKKTISTKVVKALEQVNLTGFEARFQRELSGGEQQRVALARVLVTEPQILLLDEPTVGIDPVLRESFWKHFKKLNENEITILITSHVMDDAMKCDKVIFFIEGTIVAYDTPINLVKYTKTNNLGEAFVHIVNKGYKN